MRSIAALFLFCTSAYSLNAQERTSEIEAARYAQCVTAIHAIAEGDVEGMRAELQPEVNEVITDEEMENIFDQMNELVPKMIENIPAQEEVQTREINMVWGETFRPSHVYIYVYEDYALYFTYIPEEGDNIAGFRITEKEQIANY